MSSYPDLRVTERRPASAKTPVLAMFVCPGARDVPIEHAVFPHGGGLSSMTACPGREICLWYAAHDLGGETEFNELPEEMMLGANFAERPFSCPNFHDVNHRCARRAARSRRPA